MTRRGSCGGLSVAALLATAVLLLCGGSCVVAMAVVGDEADPCAQFTTCLSCAGINGCGWCSEPITRANGTKGPQCASPSSSSPFTCNGIYSTSQCLQGYLCDQASGACRIAAPGQGTTFSQCNAACMVGPATQVYGCLNGSRTCVIVPPGTAGSASRAQCEQHCYTPAADVYACDAKTSKCVVVPSGTPNAASQEVCEAIGCDVGSFGCDLGTYTCKPGLGNQSQTFCLNDCRPADDPCSVFTTCDTCLAAYPYCGFCSVNVTYANGQVGGQCAGVNKTILPFNCHGTYSTEQCVTPTPGPAGPVTPSPNLPPRVDCPKGSTVLLQYNCASQDCNGCNTGAAAECMEPHCTLYCSGKCQPVPAWSTSFMWSCNSDAAGAWTNATLVHFLKSDQCVGPTNPPGVGGSGTYPLNSCADPNGPNGPAAYNTFMCVPCGEACDWH